MPPAAPQRRILRAVVADDDVVVRKVLRAALEQAGIGVLAGARSGLEVVHLATRLRPDVILVAVDMPDLAGEEITRRVVAAAPTVRVVLLTPGADDDEGGISAIKAGAVGYLSKRTDPRALPRIVRGVCEGEAAFTREMTLRVVDKLRRQASPTAGLRPVKSVLTAREWEVLDLLCEGATTASIAAGLGLSTETVRSHVKSILRKLQVSSRAEAVKAARRLRDAAGGVAA